MLQNQNIRNHKKIISHQSSQEKSSSKRFYEAVYKLIDHDHQPNNSITAFQEDQHQSTNGTRINQLLTNGLFNLHLDEKMKLQGYYDGYPILKVYCTLGGFINNHCVLDSQDMYSAFQKFGQLDRVLLGMNNQIAYILFRSYNHAYVAYKFMDKLIFSRQNLQLHVCWLHCSEYDQINSKPQYKQYIESINWEQLYIGDTYLQNKITQKQSKLTCKYQIQIQNQKEFQVARRIIGPKGCNMKRIIQQAIQTVYQGNFPSDTNPNQILKLRLRGKGSGYKQGPQQMESQDNLHLCVSAKDQKVYHFACKNVQSLLTLVYNEYTDFTNKQGSLISLCVKRIDMSQCAQAQFPQTPIQNVKQSQRISPSRIAQLLEMRNHARRQLNFLEADRIRNYLRNCGVCLIDEKGRRGKATDVTTWKYLF